MEVDVTKLLEKLKLSKEILTSYNESILSETDTRCKIIDFLFKDILLYEETNIKREEHYRSNNKSYYTDYIFESSKNKLLVEAKNNGVYFNLPNRIKKSSLKGILSSNKNTKDAIEQAYEYCTNNNLPVGCISNGLQFIVFLCNPLQNKYDSYIFNGYDDIVDDFINFYNIFSPFSNSENSLNNILKNSNNSIRELPQFQKNILDVLYDANKMLNRNPIYSYLESMLDIFFSDLTSEKNIKYLNDCYCTQDNTTKNDNRLKDIFFDKVPNVDIPVQDSDCLKKDFEVKRRKIKDRPLLTRKEVLLVVGGVGSGKTTFLHRFFNHIIPEESKKDLIWIHIDFIEESREDISVKEYIYLECLKQLRIKYPSLEVDTLEKLTQIYQPEIYRLQNGALKSLFLNNRTKFDEKIGELLLDKTINEIQFAEDVLRFYSTDPIFYKNICITLDNADQKSEKFQVDCITAAYDIAKRINCLMLLSMRESSYWKLKNVEPLDAYKSSAYHVSAPSISEALAKRIDVASRELGNEKIVIGINNKKYQINIKEFLGILKSSIFTKKGNTISLFDYMSANNLRFAMEMLETFLISGHTNTEEYIKTYFTNGDYVIPYHAFIRSIALGDFKFYHSDRSLFINTFEKDNDGFYSHFTRLRILRYLNERITLNSYAGKGFIDIISIFNDFKLICNNIDSFKQIVNALLSKRLIRTENGFISDANDYKYICISSAGHYYLQNMIYEFSYLERLCEDTSINSKKYFESIEKLTFEIEDSNKGKSQMQLRIKRLEVFLEYLFYEEEQENPFIRNSPIDFNFMNDIIKQFNYNKNKILN